MSLDLAAIPETLPVPWFSGPSAQGTSVPGEKRPRIECSVGQLLPSFASEFGSCKNYTPLASGETQPGETHPYVCALQGQWLCVFSLVLEEVWEAWIRASCVPLEHWLSHLWDECPRRASKNEA